VRGEHGAGAHGLLGLVERQPGLDQLAHPLDAEEAGVALVGVEHLGLGLAGERRVRADGPHAADAEQQLLVQAVVAAAAVEPVGDLALGLGVELDVGVQQQQRHAADLRPPDLRVQGAAGQLDGDVHGRAVGLRQQREREAVRVQRRVALLLPPLGVERLLEVAGPVQQPDAEDRDAEVGRRLEVVAGEDAEPAGVLRQHLGDAELRGEVGDRARRRLQRLVPARRRQVVAQVGVRLLEPRQEGGVPRERREPLRADLAEQADRVVPDGLPGLGVDVAEQVERGGVPRPAQVHHQLRERGERRGQGQADGEPAECSHGQGP
jgi:hypothetical protein